MVKVELDEIVEIVHEIFDPEMNYPIKETILASLEKRKSQINLPKNRTKSGNWRRKRNG
jgi:hypothetical protein